MRPEHEVQSVFDDLRVVEVGGGPAAACGAHFAQLGAWVVRVDTPQDAAHTTPTDAVQPRVNLGKHSIVLDPAQDRYLEVLDTLLKLADVIIADEQSPLWPDLTKRRGTLTDQRCLFLAAWGVQRPGIDLPDMEATQQACSGLWEYVGSPSARHLVEGHLATQMSGMMGFIGLLAAQLGDMRVVESSTLGTTTFMMTPLYAAESMMAEWRGHHLRGKYMPPLRGWRTRDRTIYFDFPDGDELKRWARDQRIAALDSLSAEDAVETVGTGALAPSFAEAYEEALGRLTCAEALTSIRTAGGRATEILSYDDALRSAQVQANDLAAAAGEGPHAGLTARIPVSAGHDRLGDVPVRDWSPGRDTREVLTACGYREAEVTALLACGVVLES